jgi:kinesin family protein 16B
VNGEKWTIFRRYKRFYELNQYMKEKYGHKVHLPYFPPKKWFNKSEKVVESRRKLLERYLQELVKVCQTVNSCPLNYKAFGFDELTKDCLLEFSQFFHKGCFELNKHFTA